MNIVERRIFVVECPSCHKAIDFTGDGGMYFTSKSQAKRHAALWLGATGWGNLVEMCGCKDSLRIKGGKL